MQARWSDGRGFFIDDFFVLFNAGRGGRRGWAVLRCSHDACELYSATVSIFNLGDLENVNLRGTLLWVGVAIWVDGE